MNNIYIMSMLLCTTATIHSYIISPVYNLRISESTKRQHGEFNPERPSLGTITLYTTARQQYIGTHQNAIGLLPTLIYTTESAYLRVDWSFGHVSDRINSNMISRSHTQTDDLLFSAGYSYAPNQQTKLTLSGLFGLPTHQDKSLLPYPGTTLLETQIGVGHVGLGIQLDGEFRFAPLRTSIGHSIRAAARLIHFFPRIVPTPAMINILYPTHPIFSLYPGDLLDIFLGYHITIRHHAFETGYNPSFLFHSRICPIISGFNRAANYTRSSFYIFYKYGFSMHNHESAIAIGVSGGFDNTRGSDSQGQRPFDNRYILTGWLGWGLSF